jgi:branched-chain amino acid transport system permease protein
VSAAAAASRTGTALRDVAAEARSGWSFDASAAVVAFVAAVIAPLVLGSLVATDTLAGGAYEALAATGLAICIGIAGLPSLAQGAFVATGAVTAAHLLRHTGLPGELCALLGAIAAAALGTAAGFAVRSLDSVRVAVSTWLLTWLVALALGALPWLGGGAQGLVVPSRRLFGFEPTPLVHYELAVVLTGLCALAFVALRTAPFGLDLGAAREHRSAAAALGVPIERLRVGAFAASAFVGGLAGGFAIQLTLVADPSAYSPLLSFELLVAVLVGGSLAALGPSLGVVVLGLIALAAKGLGALAGISATRFEPMLEALLVLAVLATGGSALLPAARAALERYVTLPRRRRATSATAWRPSRSATLHARAMTKRFGAVTAADDVELELAPGTLTALIGPNGSGKTTILRLLSGTVGADSGAVTVDGRDLTASPPSDRVAAGVVRTLQMRAIFPELTALETVLVGVDRTRRDGGAFRGLTRTPQFRAESREAEARALGTLALVGLEAQAEAPVATLSGAERTRVMIAAALATEPAVLLLDEPSAGTAGDDLAQLAELLAAVKKAGVAVLLVEHNLGLVTSVADEMLELENGRISPRHI